MLRILNIMQKLTNRVLLLIRNRGFFDAAQFVTIMVVCFLRGLIKGYPLVFFGKHVTIRCRKKLKIGKFSRIEDFVEIDAFGSAGITIGRETKIGKYSILRVPGVPFEIGAGISIGDRTTLAEFCFVGGAGLISIGEDNSIGQYVSIHPQNHVNSHKLSPTISKGITIGSNNWVGAKVTILDGVTLGDGNIFGAGAVVTKSFGSGKTVLGIPGKIIQQST